MSDLSKRLPTTAILVVFAYLAIRFLPPPAFSALLFVIITLGGLELATLTGLPRRAVPLMAVAGLAVALPFTFPAIPLAPSLAAATMLLGLYFLLTVRTPERLASFPREFGILALAVLYLYLPLYFLLDLQARGANTLFFLIFVVAIGDSGAYFVGRPLGRHKIYPLASPKKSLEGLIAAILTAGLAGYVSIRLFPVAVSPLVAVLTGAVTGLFSQLSDPVESLFKRAAGKKDSGTLLPGHGGVLDRMDSYVFCAPLLSVIVTLCWH